MLSCDMEPKVGDILIDNKISSFDDEMTYPQLILVLEERPNYGWYFLPLNQGTFTVCQKGCLPYAAIKLFYTKLEDYTGGLNDI